MTESQLRAQMRAYWLRRYSREQIRALFGPGFGEDGDRVAFPGGTCAHCGKDFAATNLGGSREKRFCSTVCQKRAASARDTAAKRAQHPRQVAA
jgi:hypothetical protein